MGKKFFEVFPTLKLDTGLRDLYEQVTVDKVSSTKRKDFLRIYISSERLIQKEDIFRVEGEIKKQFFPNAAMVIKFYERFQLSSQYTPEKLMEIYRDSILLELREYSPVEYNLFKHADVDFDENGKLNLVVEDTVLGKGKAEELIRILEKIYNERCGFSVEVQIAYKEHITGKYKKENDHKLAMQVAEISARAGYYTANGLAQDGAGETEYITSDMKDASETGPVQTERVAGQGGNSVTGTAIGKAGAGLNGVGGTVSLLSGAENGSGGLKGKKQFGLHKSKNGDNKKADFKRAVKRSDNPDVLYGRDFDEEAMPISEIIGEIGEVVIRGKIISMDKREIKNERTILIYDVTDFTDTMTIKLFAHNEQVGEITDGMKPGAFVKIKGMTMMDKFDHD